MGKSNTKTVVIAAVVTLIGLYRLGSPFMEETEAMEKESAKFAAEITSVRDELAQYAKGWEDKMAKLEQHVKEQLPDNINSSDILDYFVSKFEAGNAGHAWFLAVSQAPTTTFALNLAKADMKEAPRVARYKFEAQLTQERVVQYIEHIEKFAGLFMVNDYSFYVAKETANGGLKMDMNVSFFLAPKEWAGPEETKKKGPDEDDEEAEKPHQWRQIFLSSVLDNAVKAKRKPAFTGGSTAKKLPDISKIVGRAIVSDENLFEEGDKVGGWTVLGIDSATGTVTLKYGDTIKKVVVK